MPKKKKKMVTGLHYQCFMIEWMMHSFWFMTTLNNPTLTIRILKIKLNIILQYDLKMHNAKLIFRNIIHCQKQLSTTVTRLSSTHVLYHFFILFFSKTEIIGITDLSIRCPWCHKLINNYDRCCNFHNTLPNWLENRLSEAAMISNTKHNRTFKIKKKNLTCILFLL